jgi:type VI secretion system protein ImpA
LAINIDEYLKDISPNKVCGDNLEYDREFIELEQAMVGKPERQMGDTVTEAEPPNWRDIKKQSEALLSRTIDLRVLICYLRALVALDGFSGLQDGLILVRVSVEKYWDNIHPLLDTEDDEPAAARINTLLSLCDHEIMLWPLQQTPLLESKLLGRFNTRQISIAAGKATASSKEKEVNQSAIDAAIQDSDLAHLQHTLQLITVCLDNINQLETIVTDYVGISEAPSFTELRHFLKESKTFLIAALEKKGVRDNVQGLNANESTQLGDTTASAKAISDINNNQDVIKALNLVCEYYRKHEPSSPVPLFINRAIKLVGKDFMDALKDIAPTGIDEASIILGKQHNENE